MVCVCVSSCVCVFLLVVGANPRHWIDRRVSLQHTHNRDTLTRRLVVDSASPPPCSAAAAAGDLVPGRRSLSFSDHVLHCYHHCYPEPKGITTRSGQRTPSTLR